MPERLKGHEAMKFRRLRADEGKTRMKDRSSHKLLASPRSLFTATWILLLTLLAASSAWAQTWTQANTSGTPPFVNYYTHAVFDPNTGCVVYIAGSDGLYIYENSTWCYKTQAKTWTMLDSYGDTSNCVASTSTHTGNGHPYRNWAFDPSRNRIWRYWGGPCRGNWHNETWYWQSGIPGSWTRVNPSPDKPGNINATWGEGTVTYLPDQDIVMQYSGLISGSVNDVWYYSPTANSWAQQSFSGTQPPKRDGTCAVWDSFNHVAVVWGGNVDYGGPSTSEVWQYDPAKRTWTNMNPAGGPKGFWMNPCAYDSNRHKVVAYAGSGNAWAYDAKANTWTNLNASGGPTNGCGADEGPVFTYDAINDVFVYIAGCNASSANVWHLTLPPLGPAPAVSLSPPSLTFSSQLVGTTSAAQVVTLTNSGNATLSITQIVASGDFAQTNTCGSSLGAGANCTISVTFIPTATGTRTGAVTLTDNASGSPQTVALSGTGTATPPVLSLSTSSLSFGSQAVGNASAAQVVTLSNSGGALSISSIAVTGTNAGDFSQSNTCGSSVAGGANCTISVTFKPTAAGSRSAAVSITDNATGSPQTVSLSGTGTATPPGVSLSTSSVNFGNQAVNTSSGAQTVTLSNTGGSSLSITGIAISGTNAGDFTQSNTCGTSVGAGANCTISVTFKPTAAGSRTGTMSITDNAAGSPQIG